MSITRDIVSQTYREFVTADINNTFPCKDSEDDNEPCLTCKFLSICHL